MEKINKIMVCGNGGHGKDTVADYLSNKTNLRYFKSTSEFAADIVFAAVGEHMGYTSAEECWKDRQNHRSLWYEILLDNNVDLKRYKEHLALTDILNGVRAVEEFKSLLKQNLVDIALWVDATKRLSFKIEGSCKVTPALCHVYIDNNKDKDHLYKQLDLFIEQYLPDHETFKKSKRIVGACAGTSCKAVQTCGRCT